MKDIIDAVSAVMNLGAGIQNGGGVLIAMLFLFSKLSNIEKMVTKHNEILFPQRAVHFHERKDDEK